MSGDSTSPRQLTPDSFETVAWYVSVKLYSQVTAVIQGRYELAVRTVQACGG